MDISSAVFGPYTPVRRAGSMYFVSGQVGVDMTTKTAAKDVAAQTKQALKNMEQLLAACGLTLDDIVKTTIFLQNIDDYAAVNEVYEKHFEPPRPARSTVAVKSLPQVVKDTELLVEIDAVAYKESQ